MNNRVLESHAFCTSVKCAAVVYVFGGRLRVPPQGDPITIDILPDGTEETKYHFCGLPDVGFQISDLISAYSILTRGVPPGFVPKREALSMVQDEAHPIHACFRALNERDRLHRLYFDAARGRVKPFTGAEPVYITNQTKLAACLSALGHQEIGYTFDGKSAWFQFRDTPEIRQLADAHSSAWNNLLLPQDHPLYWMKSALDRRDEILQEKRRVEPFLTETRGAGDHFRVIKTPLHITPENLEKSRKYINQ